MTNRNKIYQFRQKMRRRLDVVGCSERVPVVLNDLDDVYKRVGMMMKRQILNNELNKLERIRKRNINAHSIDTSRSILRAELPDHFVINDIN